MVLMQTPSNVTDTTSKAYNMWEGCQIGLWKRIIWPA